MAVAVDKVGLGLHVPLCEALRVAVPGKLRVSVPVGGLSVQVWVGLRGLKVGVGLGLRDGECVRDCDPLADSWSESLGVMLGVLLRVRVPTSLSVEPHVGLPVKPLGLTVRGRLGVGVRVRLWVRLTDWDRVRVVVRLGAERVSVLRRLRLNVEAVWVRLMVPVCVSDGVVVGLADCAVGVSRTDFDGDSEGVCVGEWVPVLEPLGEWGDQVGVSLAVSVRLRVRRRDTVGLVVKVKVVKDGVTESECEEV